MRAAAHLAVCALALSLSLAALSCDRNPPASTSERGAGDSSPSISVALAGDVARGKVLVAKYECGRCHSGAPIEAAPAEEHCVRCHEEIIAGRFDAPAETLREWQELIVDLRSSPDLSALTQRLRPEWLIDFLQRPVDLRPHMRATMPRLRISAQEARQIVAFLASAASAPGASEARRVRITGDATRGRQLFSSRGCMACHAFGGVETPLVRTAPPKEPTEAARVLAPDLRHAAARLQPDLLVAWLRSPQTIKPDTLMPDMGLRESDAQDLAAFIVDAVRRPPEPGGAVPRLPVLERPVSFAEVERRVFKHACWHCHSDPAFTDGDGGPGNTGGFGFPARGLNLADASGVASGVLNDQGERQSVFRPSQSGVPLLVDVLLARHEEVRGRPRADLIGMPLGLPPTSLEDIQLLETWIAQGRPE